MVAKSLQGGNQGNGTCKRTIFGNEGSYLEVLQGLQKGHINKVEGSIEECSTAPGSEGLGS